MTQNTMFDKYAHFLSLYENFSHDPQFKGVLQERVVNPSTNLYEHVRLINKELGKKKKPFYYRLVCGLKPGMLSDVARLQRTPSLVYLFEASQVTLSREEGPQKNKEGKGIAEVLAKMPNADFAKWSSLVLNEREVDVLIAKLGQMEE